MVKRIAPLFTEEHILFCARLEIRMNAYASPLSLFPLPLWEAKTRLGGTKVEDPAIGGGEGAHVCSLLTHRIPADRKGEKK